MRTEVAELEDLGLSKNEARIYTALLRLGLSTSGKIINETGISVSAVYYALENLIKKSLATYVVKANRKYFQAVEPKHLLAFADEKRKAAEIAIPKLEEIMKTTHEPVVAVVHEGIKGYKGIYDRILRTLKRGDYYYIIGGGQFADPSDKELQSMILTFIRKKEKFGITAKVIAKMDLKHKVERGHEEFKFMQFRYMDSPEFLWVMVYADRVVNFLYRPRYLAIEIISKEVADAYRGFCKLMWENAKKD